MTNKTLIPVTQAVVEAMMSPVMCTYCNIVYDLGKVKVTARFADCSVFQTPCCGKEADDRTWIGTPAFKRLKSQGLVVVVGNDEWWHRPLMAIQE